MEVFVRAAFEPVAAVAADRVEVVVVPAVRAVEVVAARPGFVVPVLAAAEPAVRAEALGVLVARVVAVY